MSCELKNSATSVQRWAFGVLVVVALTACALGIAQARRATPLYTLDLREKEPATLLEWDGF
ncbi:MAG: hypothetical protein H7Z42_01295, partial [Roseiflexaceae bacterium]|nr:hypothetical protein [Roseiflexaceae bacterium]